LSRIIGFSHIYAKGFYLENIIYFGSAGTGKTKKVIEKAVEIVGNSENFKELSSKYDNHDDYRDMSKTEFDKKYNIYPLIEFITFHPNYSYQEFIEGIRANAKGGFDVIDGVFKGIAERALKNKDLNYVLIIDEINRGDVASIFGEFFTLIEENRRVGKSGEINISLPYSQNQKLRVPSNLHILATMNIVDKSISLIDVALRRRFEFIELKPDYSILKDLNSIKLSELLEKLNKRITLLKNEHYQLGHSYFLNLKSFEELKKVIITKIVPLLQEYFYEDWKSICAVLNQSYEDGGEILELVEIDENLFLPEFEEFVEHSNRKVFQVNKNFDENAVKKIYN
jgi:5-methylcytosine-specific restriction endonuclease McrBC GTP-binding regulatory subunit McrB